MAHFIPFAHRIRRARMPLLIGGATLAIALLVLALAAQLTDADGILALRPDKQQKLTVSSLRDLQGTIFFDPVTRKPAIWYTISAGGELELFSAGGFHPVTGEALKPVTRQVVQQLERRIRTLEQERVTEEERRAATARADAEIARARGQKRAGGLAPTLPVLGDDTLRNPGPERIAIRPEVSQERSATPDVTSAAGHSTTPKSLPPAERVVPGVANAPDASTAPKSSPATAPPAPAATPSVVATPETRPDSNRRGIDADEERERATRYNELVSAARILLDAGRPEEARAKAQRALRVDPSRMAARSLWAEAQTMIDAEGTPRADAGRWRRAPLGSSE